MKTTRILFWLCIISGILIISIGIYLSETGQASDGYTAGRLGNLQHGIVNGFSALFLGFLVLCLAVISYFKWKNEKKQINKLK